MKSHNKTPKETAIQALGGIHAGSCKKSHACCFARDCNVHQELITTTWHPR
ncbi:hypothetical protein GW750_04565 [bacterium]|nr:hypothetical protein [bacterium]